MFRPCGLTDSPGAAAPAGATAALIGLCFALRPIGLFRRVTCVAFAFIGIAVIYYTQIRSTLVMLAIGLMVITFLMMIRGRAAQALTLAFGSGGMILAALFWVARRMGSGVLDRFRTLVDSNSGNLYGRSRGGFVWEALTKTVWDNPLGLGLGWWGMIHSTFRNPARYSTVWVEVMIPAWVIDGGFPLLILYMGAVIVTIIDSFRIALKSKDPDVMAWAPLVVALNISTLALSFSFVTFVTPIGQQFWLLNAVLYVADTGRRSSRAERPAAVQPGRVVVRSGVPGRCLQGRSPDDAPTAGRIQREAAPRPRPSRLEPLHGEPAGRASGRGGRADPLWRPADRPFAPRAAAAGVVWGPHRRGPAVRRLGAVLAPTGRRSRRRRRVARACQLRPPLA